MYITPSTVTDPLVSKIRHLFEKKYGTTTIKRLQVSPVGLKQSKHPCWWEHAGRFVGWPAADGTRLWFLRTRRHLS